MLGKREIICEKCGIENEKCAIFCKKSGLRMQTTPPISTDPPKKITAPQSPTPNIPNNSLIKIQKPKIYKKPYHIFWICDCSESLDNVAVINKIIPLAIKDIREVKPIFRMTIRTIKFSNDSEWVDKENIPIDQYTWKNLSSERGGTALGAAFIKVAHAIKTMYNRDNIHQKVERPLLILITSGYPTDDWKTGLNILNEELDFWGSCRIALTFSDTDTDVFREFVGKGRENDTIIPITAYQQITKILYYSYIYDGGYPFCDITCYHCNYEWRYMGSYIPVKAQCPRCHDWVKMI